MPFVIVGSDTTGFRDWELDVDDEGHRTFGITFHLKDTGGGSGGPLAVWQAAGLPTPGSVWNFKGDTDIWAFCLPYGRVRQINSQEHGLHWTVEKKFSTKPPDRSRCQDQSVENPLLEPPKKSGNYTKYSREASHDLYGNLITNSAWEQIRGQQVEFDESDPAVRIVLNSAVLGIELWGPMVNTLNAFPLWGVPRRCLKLSSATWEEKYYGQCFVYYTITFDFDVHFGDLIEIGSPLTGDYFAFYTGFDRNVLDEGSKVLNGAWDDQGRWVLKDVGWGIPADPNNPNHFMRAVDRAGNPMRIILNGSGLPADTEVVGLATNVPLVNKYVCIAPSSGNHFTNTSFFMPWSGKKFGWFPTSNFRVGDALTHGLDLGGGEYTSREFICVADNTNQEPPNPLYWFQFPNLTRERGYFSNSEGYSIGDIVKTVGVDARGTRKTGVGNVLVQKYRENNFLLLGVPLFLGA